MAVLLAAGGLWLRFFGAGDQHPVASKIVPLTTYPGDVGGGSFSPDASHMAFSWNGGNQDNYDIYVKVLDSETALRLTRTRPPMGLQPGLRTAGISHLDGANAPGARLHQFI